MNILIIEDDEAIARLLVRSIHRIHPGATVDTVPTLSLAQDSLRDSKYELCFIDIHLPDGDGTEILSTIPDACVTIGMSGNMIPFEDRKRFDCFLEKPFPLAKVESILAPRACKSESLG